jgi:hypothetical protein
MKYDEDDVYLCDDCHDYHISDSAIRKLPWHTRFLIKIKLIRI